MQLQRQFNQIQRLSLLNIEDYSILSEILSSADQKTLKMSSRVMTKKIHEILLHWQTVKINQQHIAKQFKNLVNLIYTIIHCFDHWEKAFPYFKNIFGDYLNTTKEELKIINSKIRSKLMTEKTLTHEDCFSKDKNQKEIPSETQKWQKIVQKVTVENVSFFHDRCLNCCQVFFSQQKIQSEDFIGQVIKLNKKYVRSEEMISRAIQILFNSGNGGIILFQARQFSFKQYNRFLSRINSALDLVQPKTYEKVQISFTPVQSLFSENKEKMEYIAKIFVKPNFSVYFLNQKNGVFYKPQFYEKINEQFIKIEDQKIYHFIHQKHKKLKEKKYVPSHICQPLSLNLNFIEENGESSDDFDEEIDQGCEYWFKFEKQAVIIVSSSKKEFQMDNFCEYLKRTKFKYYMCKPFKQIQRKSNHSIWLISYSEKYEILKQRVEEFKKLGKACVAVLQKNLEIHECKKKLQHLEGLKRTFKRKFHKTFTTSDQLQTDEEGYQLQLTYLKFESLIESLFSFIFLSNKGVKSFFRNEKSSKSS